MFITAETNLIINNTPEAIWGSSCDLPNGTALNPDEHFGLTYSSNENRPATGVAFLQQEYRAGVYTDLQGRSPHLDRIASPYESVRRSVGCSVG